MTIEPTFPLPSTEAGFKDVLALMQNGRSNRLRAFGIGQQKLDGSGKVERVSYRVAFGPADNLAHAPLFLYILGADTEAPECTAVLTKENLKQILSYCGPLETKIGRYTDLSALLNVYNTLECRASERKRPDCGDYFMTFIFDEDRVMTLEGEALLKELHAYA